MKILSIDTATEVCSVAILENESILKEKTLTSINTHSVSLMPLIKETLQECNLDLKDIDLFVCDKGPGSFTGIRIGLSTIKAFCDVTNKPCIGVTSLEGFAHKISNFNGIICSLLNANHKNVYSGIFEMSNGTLSQIEDYTFDNIENLLMRINAFQKNVFFVGNCGTLFKDMIQSLCNVNFEISNDKYISAVDIGKAGISKFYKGLYGDSDFLTPLYLKKSSAESQGSENGNL